MIKSIQKTNEFFKISGVAPDDENPIHLTHSQYMIQGSEPISYEISSIWQLTNQENRVSSSAGSLDVTAIDGSCCQFTGNVATAEAQYVFKSIAQSTISLKLTGHVESHAFENNVTFSLKEIEGNSVVDEKTWTVEEAGQLEIDEELSCVIKPGFDYRITLTAGINCGEVTGVRSALKATIV